MEKKKKRVFVLGLVALLSVISIGMILLCRNIQSENQGTQTVDVSAVSREMLLFMLDQTRVVNKDYSVLSLGEDVKLGDLMEIGGHYTYYEKNCLQQGQILSTRPILHIVLPIRLPAKKQRAAIRHFL